MRKIDLGAPFFTLSKVGKLRTIVHRNGLKDLCKTISVFVLQHPHSCYNCLAGLAGNEKDKIVLRFLLNHREHNGFLTNSLTHLIWSSISPAPAIGFAGPVSCTTG